jgi:transposase
MARIIGNAHDTHRPIRPARGASSNSEVSRLLGVSLPTVGTWRARYVTDRHDGLFDKSRSGRPRTVVDADVERLVVATPDPVA